MLSLAIRRVCVLVALATVCVIGAASAASADAGATDAAPAVTSTQLTADTAPAPGPDAAAAAAFWNVTFDRILTAGLWNASTGGVVAMRLYCATAVYSFLRAPCNYIADNLFGRFRSLGPPNGRCLNVSPRLGWPPINLRYVTCP